MSLQRFTMDHMPGFAKVVRGTLAMIRFFGVVRGTTALLHCAGLGKLPCYFPLGRARHTSHNIPN
jgi:hypothetical protein